MRRFIGIKLIHCVSIFILFGLLFTFRLQISIAVNHAFEFGQFPDTRNSGEMNETVTHYSTYRPWLENGISEHENGVRNCSFRNVSLSDKPLPFIGLVSFPGSGNTWTRHLIQQMTGIGTSSVYCDIRLKESGFPFECYHDKKNQTIVIKSHLPKHVMSFKKIVFLIRNPYDALLSYAKFKMSGHTKNPSDLRLREEIDIIFEPMLDSYIDLVQVITEQFRGPVHVLQYEKLKSNLTAELKKLSKFLPVHVTDDNIMCTVKLQEGKFHRKTTEQRHFQLLNFIYQGYILMRIQEIARLSEDILNDAFGLNLDLTGPEKNIFDLRQ